jgi:tetratricopeptide (TPR) repeat protein
MDNLLLQYVQSPKDIYLNFDLARAYKDIKHYAGACTYFLRAAEWADTERDKGLIYEALMQISLCFKELGNRKFSEEGWLLHAISVWPTRPEAYWLLAELYKSQQKWQEAYTMCSIGLSNSTNALSLLIDIGYKGEYVLTYLKVELLWNISGSKEARKILFNMADKYELDDDYRQWVHNSICFIGTGANKEDNLFTNNKANNLRYIFNGNSKIDRNYSEAYQDIYVLSMLDGKENGYYLEIGSGQPIIGNNTYLLESKFNWKGLSVDNNKDFIQQFKNTRNNPVFDKDATNTNYTKLLQDNGAPEIIDYLQIDIEPAMNSYIALVTIPFEKYKFRVITFEHDHKSDMTRRVKDLSRKYLSSLGYVLVADSIAVTGEIEFEDWWVHPELVDPEILEIMKSVNGKIKLAKNYMLNL